MKTLHFLETMVGCLFDHPLDPSFAYFQWVVHSDVFVVAQEHDFDAIEVVVEPVVVLVAGAFDHDPTLAAAEEAMCAEYEVKGDNQGVVILYHYPWTNLLNVGKAPVDTPAVGPVAVDEEVVVAGHTC